MGPELARSRRSLEDGAPWSKRPTQHHEATLVQERILERAQAGIGSWLGGADVGNDFGHRSPIAQDDVAVQQRLQYRHQSGDAAGMIEVLQLEFNEGAHTENLGRLFADFGESVEPELHAE